MSQDSTSSGGWWAGAFRLPGAVEELVAVPLDLCLSPRAVLVCLSSESLLGGWPRGRSSWVVEDEVVLSPYLSHICKDPFSN